MGMCASAIVQLCNWAGLDNKLLMTWDGLKCRFALVLKGRLWNFGELYRHLWSPEKRELVNDFGYPHIV